MDNIHPVFYDIIRRELIEHVSILETDIPAVITREYLQQYSHGITGSAANPIVYLNIPVNMMVKYGNQYFEGGGTKKPCVPVRKLYESGSSLHTREGPGKLYKLCAYFIKDKQSVIKLINIPGNTVYWNITLETRSNVDILHFNPAQAPGLPSQTQLLGYFKDLPHFNFSSDHITESIKNKYWDLLDYILSSPSINHNKRLLAMNNILIQTPEVLGSVPTDLLLKFYNWRKHRVTQLLHHILAAQGKELAQRISVIPFKPSKLRIMQGREN